MHHLTDTEREFLAIERLSWRFRGAKEQAIRDKFDLSWTAYHQQLGRLIDTERAMAADPITVKRLRAVRDRRKRTRGRAA